MGQGVILFLWICQESTPARHTLTVISKRMMGKSFESLAYPGSISFSLGKDEVKTSFEILNNFES